MFRDTSHATAEWLKNYYLFSKYFLNYLEEFTLPLAIYMQAILAVTFLRVFAGKLYLIINENMYLESLFYVMPKKSVKKELVKRKWMVKFL